MIVAGSLSVYLQKKFNVSLKTSKQITMETYLTTYREAVNWLGNDFILCNEIVKFDDSVFENFRWDYEDDPKEIFQWYLTSASEDDVEFLEEHFNLMFSYSCKLDLYVLAVPHYGTAWDYVEWETDIKNAACKLGERVKPF